MSFNHNVGDRKSTAKSTRKSAAKKPAAKKTASIKTAARQKLKTSAPKKAAKRGAKAVAVSKSTARGAVEESAAGEMRPAGAESADPFEIARQTMKGSVPAIVKTMVKLAKQGSCSHAKTLLEMTGAKHMFSEEAESQDNGEPWAKLVLERMEKAEQESPKAEPL